MGWSSEAGITISAAMSMGRFQYGIRQSPEMVNQMTSMDRVIEFGKTHPEAPLESSKGFYTVYCDWVFVWKPVWLLMF